MDRKTGLLTAAGNIGYAASYWMFPLSYRFYRLQKRLFNGVFSQKTPVLEQPKYDRDMVVIQGFRHSGNLFIESNAIAEDQHRILPIRHRSWIIKGAVDHGVPVILLVRHPRDVIVSTVYRTTTHVVTDYPLRIFPWAVLCAWIGYHRAIMRFRPSLFILPFDLIASNYPGTCRMISDRTGIRMNTEPTWDRVNRYAGPRWEVKLSWLSRILLRKADAIYAALVASSPQSALPSPVSATPVET